MKKKSLLLVAMVACLSLASMFTSLAGEWKSDAIGKWYVNDDGSYPVNAWKEVENKHYYFGADGYLLVNTTTATGHQVGADGAWLQPVLTEAERAYEANDAAYYYMGQLSDKIIFKQLTTLDAVYADIDKNMAGQSATIVSEMKEDAKYTFDYWVVRHSEVDNQPRPWTAEELANNPLISQYTREEMEAMDKAARDAGF